MRGRTYRVIGGVAALLAIATFAIAISSSGSARPHLQSKFARGDVDAEAANQDATPGEGPLDGLEAYLAAQRTYPANVIPPGQARRSTSQPARRAPAW